MKQLEKKLTGYLEEVTGINISVHHLDTSHWPIFLARLYDIAEVKLGTMAYRAIFLKRQDEFKPVSFLKHLSQILGLNQDAVCVVAEFLPSYIRKRMIENRISFVIPNTQMYLPALGMELRSRARNSNSKKPNTLSPATQVVLIHGLLGRIEKPVTPLELSRSLSYSPMSMSRALDELGGLELGHVERSGKERLLVFEKEKRLLWNEALPRLKNPVRHLKRIDEQDLRRNALLLSGDVLPAGITALSKNTMISVKEISEYAVSADAWQRLEKAGVGTIPVDEEGTCVLQVWRYAPRVLEVDGMVDPFSLYLSFQEQADDRIGIALEEMLGRYL